VKRSSGATISRPASRPVRRTAVAVLGAIAMVASLFSGANAASAATICGDAVFLGVRGTDAPAGSGSAHSGRIWTSGGMGDQVASLYTQVVGTGIPYYSASLNYPASGGANYSSSVETGVNTLVAELNWLATQCGSVLPIVILAGHSQGAQVILDALSWATFPYGTELTPNAKKMIRAVAVFGDPTYLPNRSINAPMSASGVAHGIFPRNLILADSLENSDYSFYGYPYGEHGMGTVYKIRSYCLAGDFFCQSDLSDSNFAIHNSYASPTTGAVINATNWITYMISSPS